MCLSIFHEIEAFWVPSTRDFYQARFLLYTLGSVSIAKENPVDRKIRKNRLKTQKQTRLESMKYKKHKTRLNVRELKSM